MAIRSLFETRQQRLTLAIFTVAFVICGIAWMRFFSVLAINPSPVRYVDYVTAEGLHEPFRQDCAGPSFVETADDTVWRFCEYTPGAGFAPSDDWGLVRFELTSGTARMLWPLPEPADAQILALSRTPQADIAVAWGSPDLHAVYLIRDAGGVMPLALPDDAPQQIAGFGWNDNALEIVGSDATTTTIYTLAVGADSAAGTDAATHTTRTIARPPACETADAVCTLQVAQHTGTTWRTIYAIAPRDAVPDAAVTIVAMPEDGTPETLDTVTLDTLHPDQYTVNANGDVIALGTIVEQSPGNVVNWSLRAAPLVLDGDSWHQVNMPAINASFYFSDYTITGDGGLRWIPGVRAPQRSWHVNNWVTLRTSSDGELYMAEVDGKQGKTLAEQAAFNWQSGADTALLPASDGGYWVLGPHGAYLKATADYDRADTLNLTERVTHTFEKFGRLDDVSDGFYRERRVLKMAAFPLVLLSLPAGYLLVFAVRQSRQHGHAWLRLLMQISALYIVIATVFIWWFWEIMDHF